MCFSRRQFIQSASVASALAATTGIGIASYAQQPSSDAPKNAEEALAVLKEGNQRFVSGE